MKAPEITVSRPLHNALLRAFIPYLDPKKPSRMREDLLQYRGKELPLALKLELASKLENVFALEGGEEGAHILDMLDGVMNGSGAPALLLHNMPCNNDRGIPEGLSTIIGEAFRQRMLDAGSKHLQPEYGLDQPDPDMPSGYRKSGMKQLHHDRGDYVVLFGIDEGANPRHTALFDAEEFVDYLVNRVHGSAQMSQAERDQLAVKFTMLLQMPIWRLPETAGINNAVEARRAEKMVHTREGSPIEYSPMFYTNPAFDPNEPGSVRYRFCVFPFSSFYERSLYDTRAVPPQLKPAVLELEEVLQGIDMPFLENTGPVLKSGDMLVINNHLLLHAGGPYVHERLDIHDPRPRRIGAIDIFKQPYDYHAKPSDKHKSMQELVTEARNNASLGYSP